MPVQYLLSSVFTPKHVFVSWQIPHIHHGFFFMCVCFCTKSDNILRMEIEIKVEKVRSL